MREYWRKTQRIGFGHWEKEDLPLAELLWGEADVTRYISANGVFSAEEIQKRLLLETKNLQNFGVQYFPVFHLDSGELIGCCGLRPTTITNHFELGFHLRKKFWRQGYAFEAANSMIQYAFTELQAAELFAGHNPKNLPSRNLLLKLGFSYVSDEFYAPTGLMHPSYLLKKDMIL